MNIYYGKETKQSLENFPFPLPVVQKELIYEIVGIKKAAAMANRKCRILPKNIANAIVKVCDEILSGAYDDQFVTCSLQGGAGTSINMNVNEVIANRASAISGEMVHPNDHVNCSQSTNDVNPSALKIICIKLTKQLIDELTMLLGSIEIKSKEWKDIKKLGRTHLQDAIPTTLGAQFQSYGHVLLRDKERIEDILPYLHELNLGGTAIGNSISAPEKYKESVYKYVQKHTGLSVRRAGNLMSQTSSATDFCHLSSVITILYTDLNKIANDLRFMASGPRGGIQEISLSPLQAGSSIMPGKVNPVIPEVINQITYDIEGKNLTIHLAAQNAHLELAVMFPILADSLLTILKIARIGCTVFAKRCIDHIIPHVLQCEMLLDTSTAYATLLVPTLGYDMVSDLVKEAISSGVSLRKLVVQKKLLTSEQLDTIIAVYM